MHKAHERMQLSGYTPTISTEEADQQERNGSIMAGPALWPPEEGQLITRVYIHAYT